MIALQRHMRGLIFVLLISLIGCTQTPGQDSPQDEILDLPALKAVELNGNALKVVATTSIIGDVVAQVGGDAIELTTLMGPGQDPHSYTPGARELTAVANADVIFVNGWNLEEGLVADLDEISADIPLVPISAKIEPLVTGVDAHDHEQKDATANDHQHSNVDPHVWFSIPNVTQWTQNVAVVLSELDPQNSEVYANNAAAYLEALDALAASVEPQLAAIPAEKRFLVTNHDTFSYFANAYDFELIGTVIPAASTLAEPSASDLTELIAEMETHAICTIFTENTINDALAQTITAELDSCDEVRVVQLYTGALGAANSGADNYIDMFRTNVAAIVAGLR